MSEVFTFINRRNDCWGNSLLQLMYNVRAFRDVLYAFRDDAFLGTIYDTYKKAIECSKFTMQHEKYAGPSGQICDIMKARATANAQYDPKETFINTLVPYICNKDKDFLRQFLYPIMQNFYCAVCGTITDMQLEIDSLIQTEFPMITLLQHVPSLNLKYGITSCEAPRFCPDCKKKTEHNSVYEHVNLFPPYIMYSYMVMDNSGAINNINKSIPRTLLHDSVTNIKYELAGCILHYGEDSNSGHFIAYCKRWQDGNKPQWYEFNDDKYRLADPPLCSKKVWMALYERVNV